ncbi:hypothetical protein CWI75_06535 [Kineobactrum sediminis]|uniref:Transcriptional regulator SutA RNAP-binding domain-containing protein n=1 Tax=Kineobactrum sediminis TaxID=1905677 RepID=A0A2N5Y3U8_9GAMM|nr:hypothetical protein [Kineobactrum sediminis]PLW83075.1 hypothetical protein CWI75_06535 [Kineobactrum sediminis]
MTAEAQRAPAEPQRTPPKPQRAPAKKKQPAAVETSMSIEEQTQAFLQSGGEIQNIKSGISGQQGGYSARPSGAAKK